MEKLTTFYRNGLLKNLKEIYAGIAIIILLCCGFGHANATTYVSNGGGGNWNNSGTWTPAGIPGTGDIVTIQNGDVVTLTANAVCKNITITGFESCLLCLCGCPNSELKLGTYTLTVEGSFTNNSTFTPNTGTVLFDGSIAQTIGGTGTLSFYKLTVNSTSTVTLSADISITNLLTMTTGTFATGVFTMNGAGGITATGGDLQLAKLGVTLPELTGAYTLSGGTVSFLGAGSQTIRGGKTFYNIYIGGAVGTKTLGGATTINGDLTINSSTMDVSINNYAVTIAGNWTNNASYTAESGTVTFNGSAAEAIGGTATTTFHNLTVNKASGTLTLNQNAILDNTGVLTLTTGPVAINKYTLTVNNGATTAIVRTSGYLISEDNSTTAGKANNSSYLTWAINANTGSHIYPFGTAAGSYLPFTYNLTAGNAGSVTVSTYHTANDNTPFPIPVTSVCDTTYTGVDDSQYAVDRFWNIVSSGGTANLTFTYDNPTDIAPLSGGVMGTDGKGLRAQQWSNSTNRWLRFYNPAQNHNTGTNSVTISGFSGALTSNTPWALALHISPLPISLLNFKVALNLLSQAEISWQTTQEINNKEFIVERSTDGNTFNPIAKINGIGNSQTINNYETFDRTPFPGISYYRLKQIDFNGGFSYSSVVVLNNAGITAPVAIFPNPVESSVHITFNSLEALPLYLNIYNEKGQILFQETLDPVIGMNDLSFDASLLRSGIYYLTLSYDNKEIKYHNRFVKN